MKAELGLQSNQGCSSYAIQALTLGKKLHPRAARDQGQAALTENTAPPSPAVLKNSPACFMTQPLLYYNSLEIPGHTTCSQTRDTEGMRLLPRTELLGLSSASHPLAARHHAGLQDGMDHCNLNSTFPFCALTAHSSQLQLSHNSTD